MRETILTWTVWILASTGAVIVPISLLQSFQDGFGWGLEKALNPAFAINRNNPTATALIGDGMWFYGWLEFFGNPEQWTSSMGWYLAAAIGAHQLGRPRDSSLTELSTRTSSLRQDTARDL